MLAIGVCYCWTCIRPGERLAGDGDPTDLARAILTALSDEGLTERIGEKGRETAYRYDWKIVVSQLERTLFSALDFEKSEVDRLT